MPSRAYRSVAVKALKETKKARSKISKMYTSVLEGHSKDPYGGDARKKRVLVSEMDKIVKYARRDLFLSFCGTSLSRAKLAGRSYSFKFATAIGEGDLRVEFIDDEVDPTTTGSIQKTCARFIDEFTSEGISFPHPKLGTVNFELPYLRNGDIDIDRELSFSCSSASSIAASVAATDAAAADSAASIAASAAAVSKRAAAAAANAAAASAAADVTAAASAAAATALAAAF